MQFRRTQNSNQFVSSDLSTVDGESDVEKVFLASQVRQRRDDVVPVVVPTEAKQFLGVVGSHLETDSSVFS